MSDSIFVFTLSDIIEISLVIMLLGIWGIAGIAIGVKRYFDKRKVNRNSKIGK